MQSAAVFLYNLFSPSPEWCRAHGEAIKKTLGPYPASVATRACNNVKKIIAYLAPLETDTSREEDKKMKDSDLLKNEFGHKIHFKFEANLLDSAQSGLSDAGEHDSLSEEDETSSGKLSSDLLAGLTQSGDSRGVTAAKLVREGGGERGGGGGGKYGAKWLEEQCQKCQVSGHSWKQVYGKIFDLLTTASDDVQNDVSDHLLMINIVSILNMHNS